MERRHQGNRTGTEKRGLCLVLVVDGDPAHRDGVVARLATRYVVHAVRSVREAIAFLRSHAVDLVILDVSADEWDGFAVFSCVGTMVRRPKVIAMAPSGALMQAARAIQLGADDCIAHPFTLGRLTRAIHDQLSHQVVA